VQSIGWHSGDTLAAAVLLVLLVLTLRDTIFANRNPNRYVYTIIIPAVVGYFLLKITFDNSNELGYQWQLAALATAVLLLLFPMLWAVGTLFPCCGKQNIFVAVYQFSKYISAATALAVFGLIVAIVSKIGIATILGGLLQVSGLRAVAAAVIFLLTPLYCFVWYSKILHNFNLQKMRRVLALSLSLIALPLIATKLGGMQLLPATLPILTASIPKGGAATIIAPLAVLLLATTQLVINLRREPTPPPHRRADPNQSLHW